MSDVVAVLEQDDDPQVLAMAATMATLLGCGSRQTTVPSGTDRDGRSDAITAALRDDDLAVLHAGGPESVCWDVIRRVTTPVMVLPQHPRVPARVTEVLLPLDGAPGTAAAVAAMAQRLVGAGVHVTAMHVFDAATAPAFWDQAAHSYEHWTEEFLLRNLPWAVELDLRRGRSCDEVVTRAEHSDADLLMVGWGQDLGGGRAQTVLQALTAGHVPLLLLPVTPQDLRPQSEDLAPSTTPPPTRHREA
ncbi:universal stress protein [Nocardioides rubriscoriae]|uniref:universal stress protein n=1 Tax=Nocardioides rubriscoriae TaxID=642762 RepID=UPI0011DFB31F|nr:universal stress protein [Nocardioides rubriscoriae]